MNIFQPKQTVRTESSDITCEVEQLLGSGGQGEVYETTLGNQPMALKWYYPHTATPEQRAILEILVKKGPPSDKFLWPVELVVADGVAGFGYLMPLREARYKGMLDLLKRRVEPSFRVLTTVGLELAHSYLQLHAQGLCYCDISFGNVFFDPNTGDVLICDNDNVIVNGERPGVKGTMRFMAPEVVRDEALPSTQTDLFSLAILLFYMFMGHHPMEGEKEAAIPCLDLPAMIRLYGTEPVFIFDPDDPANRPVIGVHDNALAFWPIYPQFLRDLFTQAFTRGIRDPQNGRIVESDWRDAMTRLRDAIIYCPSCTAESFYDAAASKRLLCWSCNNEARLPMHISIGKNLVMLNHDTQLFPHHVDNQRRYDFSQPVAAVTQHPTNPQIWGLRNLSTATWNITSPNGTVRDVEPGRSATLAVGTKITFGNTEGEIRETL